MIDENWHRVYQAYRSACQLPPAERATFLAAELEDPALCAMAQAFLDESATSERHTFAEAAEPPLESDPEWTLLGKNLGRFEVRGSLGRGGMGEVYRAFDPELGREVAIKCIPSRRAGADSVASFIREARAASALNHPGIVTVHEVIREDGAVAIVMELVSGESLRSLAGRPQPESLVARIGQQTAEALGATHASGIVHRDIKPENLILRPDGYLKIVDFGLASDPESTLGSPMGTLRYMAPEQYAGAEVGPAADVFALGVLLYELATGVHPFAAVAHSNSTFAIGQAIASQPPPRPSTLNPKLSRSFDALIAQMLSRDAARRPPAMAVASRLRAMERPQRKKRLWAGVATAILIMGVAGFLLRKNDSAWSGPIAFIPVTSYEGKETQPAISPDGSKLAFVWTGKDDDNEDIYIKPLRGEGLLRLTDNPGEDLHPAWSPDGQRIAFLRQGPGNPRAEVVIIPSGGGEEWVVAQVASPETAVQPLAWWPDGKSLLVRSGANGSSPLWRIPLDALKPAGKAPWIGNGPGRRFSRDIDMQHEAPTFTKDGARLAFIDREGSHYSACEMTLEGYVRDCVKAAGAATGLAWESDGSALFFSDASGLWRLPAKGHKLGTPQLIAQGKFPDLAGAPDNGRLVYSRAFSDVNIWRIGADGSQAEKLIASSGEDSEPQYSPGGEELLFRSDRDGQLRIYRSRADGSNPVPLTSMPGKVSSAIWSPDGKSILFDAMTPATTYANIYRMDAAGGEPRRLTDDKGGYLSPARLRESDSIYFIQGRLRTLTMASEGAPMQTLFQFAAIDLTESADGKYLYFMKRSGQPGIWRVERSGGTPAVLGGTQKAAYRAWVLAKTGVYFAEDGKNPQLFFRDNASGAIRRIGRLPGRPPFGPRIFSISPGGQWLLYSSEDVAGADIVLLQTQR